MVNGIPLTAAASLGKHSTVMDDASMAELASHEAQDLGGHYNISSTT
jgi:hypothetical protein